MALISCPYCGEQVSEKAEKCVHCGMVLKEETIVERTCAECGTILSEEDESCPHCGCPVEKPKPEEPQKVEVTNFKFSFNKKKRNIILAVIAIVILGSITGIIVKKNLDQKRIEEYQNNLSEAVSTMLSGASKAEKAGNLVHSVWSNAIYEKEDDETDKYVKDSDFIYFKALDFNDALANLYADSSFQTDISAIEYNQKKVQSYMKELKNPPSEFEEAYEALKKFYDAYNELVGCATNPTGSLSTYTSSFNEADSNTLNCYKAMDIYIK